MQEYRRRSVQTRKTSKLGAVIAILKRLNWRGRVILACIALVFVAALIFIFLPKGGPVQVGSVDMPIPTETDTEQTLLPTATPVPTTTPEVTPDPTLKEGDENESVQELQDRLMDLGFLDIDESTQKFGPATKQAVKLFQRQIGVKQSGVADGEMQAWLYAADAKHYTLLKGMEGEDVRTLQFRLNELGYLADGKLTSKYGDLTVKAVIKFQKANGLSADGKTGEDTLDRIYSSKAKPTAEKRAEQRGIRNAKEVITAAEKALGKPYIGGREGPKSFDCSGLVHWCLHQAGSTVGRFNAQGYSAVERWEVVCEGTMNFNQLQKGDLLFFHVPTRNKKIGHVAIYVGNHTIIDASSSNGKVVKRKCDTPWFVRNFRLARRPYGSV